MAKDDADHIGPRVGGWVPVYREQHPAPNAPGTDDDADRLYATPSTDTGSFRHSSPEKGRSRAVLIVAAIVAMVLLSAGGITYALHNQSPSRTAGAAPFSPAPASDPGFTDTQQNPGLTVSQSPPSAVSGPPSSAVPSEVSTSTLPSTTEPTTTAPAKKPTPGKSKKTATPVTLSSLTPGLPVSLEPVSLPGTRLRHYAGEAFVQKIDTSSATAKGDSRWIVHSGLGDSTCISLESSNFPGQYLRRLDGRVRKDTPDGTSQFNVEATFCAEKVNGSSSRVQLRTADTFQYIKRQGDILFMGDGGVAGETFLVKTPF